ncbi:DeoR/GlpR family DNA-binding transcription regulator [Catenisphaera adipataccumulans]|jgi:DeoR/GlpR family transcriptional regulator of sugar metabolism|uniref:DeoR/GlpR family transcriptional regulator of sugar metabolism n=1 Tax=Catenisphaera adipataccumulans TaxID=700500 RepID=A0A7W8FU56_9FIRM|nr:DeoR/GlpR family DNA-binding transcription regulator [Catenisphaera adipataccumulans]MBB5182244.1 DeoR/GlpR family transcriptional regulator of sugar metabolism [Catenisphaera adipataccumulans]
MANHRIDEMQQYIHDQGKVTVSELSQKWNITQETVRRDLDKLEAVGMVTRVHGGAIWNESIRFEGVYFYHRQKRNLEAKRKLAVSAAEVIRPYTILFADASSTVLEAMRLIQDDPDMIVVTNSAELFLDPANIKMHVISTGGIFNNNSMSFQGEVTKNAIRNFNAKLAVIGCKGLIRSQGVLDSYEGETEIKKEMLKHADRVMLMADHTKFDQTAFIKLSSFAQIDYLVTDCRPSDEWVDILEAEHVQLIYPE